MRKKKNKFYDFIFKIFYLINFFYRNFKNIGKYQYYNKFSTYKQAMKYSKEYFDPDPKIKFISPKDIGESDRRFIILPSIISVLKKKNLKILDYGGGNNPIFSYIKATTNISTKTYVIEKKKYCEIIKKKIPNKLKKYIKYFTSIKHIKIKKFDIICFNSSIQYLENYKEIIIELKKFQPKYILITRTIFQLENKDYYTLESMIKGNYHPYIFFSYKKFISFLSRNNYKLIFSNKHYLNRYKHEFIEGKKFLHRDLLFVKIEKRKYKNFKNLIS